MDPLDYLSKKFHTDIADIVVEDEHTLVVDPSPMSRFEKDSNCCTLVAIFKILKYLRNSKPGQFPGDNELWQLVYEKALKLGYTKQKGIGVTKNDNLLRELLNDCPDFSGTLVKSHYFALVKPEIIKKELDNDHPVLLSMASGQYFNHTILVMGYKIYKNKITNQSYTFLLVTDGWNAAPDYFPWTNTKENHIGCITTFKSAKGTG